MARERDPRKEELIQEIYDKLCEQGVRTGKGNGSSRSTAETQAMAECWSEFVDGITSRGARLPIGTLQFIQKLKNTVAHQKSVGKILNTKKQDVEEKKNTCALLAYYLWKYHRDLYYYYMGIDPITGNDPIYGDRL